MAKAQLADIACVISQLKIKWQLLHLCEDFKLLAIAVQSIHKSKIYKIHVNKIKVEKKI